MNTKSTEGSLDESGTAASVGMGPADSYSWFASGPARTSTQMSYEKRMARVFDYVHSHLDEQLDLNSLAEIACTSPYHWHRVYQSMNGESIATTVKRLRLQRAADWLANTDRAVIDVARRSGYSGVPAFNRAFKAAYGMPPARYRDEGSHTEFRVVDNQSKADALQVEVRNMPQFDCVAVPHTGRYLEVDRAFGTLFNILHREQAIDGSTQMLGVYFDDPAFTEASVLESLACATVSRNIIDEDIERYVVPAGVHAVLRHRGPYADMHAAYNWLYGRWLPRTDYETADLPVFEIYLNNPRDTAPADLLVDICLPLTVKDR